MARPSVRNTLGNSLTAVDAAVDLIATALVETKHAARAYGNSLEMLEAYSEDMVLTARDPELREIRRQNIRARLLTRLKEESAELDTE